MSTPWVGVPWHHDRVLGPPSAMIQEEPLDIVALRHRGRFVVLLKEHDDRTETLVRSIRFR